MDPLTTFLLSLGAATLSDLRDRPRRPFQFVGACPDLTGPLVNYVTDCWGTGSARRFPRREITYRTFARYCDLGALRREGHPATWQLTTNWTVSYHQTQLPSGVPAFYFDWSAMEHLFVAGPFDLRRESRLAEMKLTEEDARDYAIRAREQLGGRLPAPTTLNDCGMQGGYVFDTTSPRVVVRVGPADRSQLEWQLVDDDYAGGVVRVLGITEVGKHLVTWKEKLDLDVQGHIYRRYADPARRDDILGALLNLYYPSGHTLAVLVRAPETRGLALAIQRGMPATDLDLHHNLGVTRDGRVVAYDL